MNGGILFQVPGEARDKQSRECDVEERPVGHSGQMPGVRDQGIQDR